MRQSFSSTFFYADDNNGDYDGDHNTERDYQPNRRDVAERLGLVDDLAVLDRLADCTRLHELVKALCGDAHSNLQCSHLIIDFC